jgi:hypothetical protein
MTLRSCVKLQFQVGVNEQEGGRGYVINVTSNRNGVGCGLWTHVDGWSEAVIDYIAELEAGNAN